MAREEEEQEEEEEMETLSAVQSITAPTSMGNGIGLKLDPAYLFHLCTKKNRLYRIISVH